MKQLYPTRLATILSLLIPCFSTAHADNISELPGGLWFAQKGGNICYLNNGLHDTGVSAGAHPFQMQVHGDALYVADTGESHYYSENGYEDGTGDGMLYKVE